MVGSRLGDLVWGILFQGIKPEQSRPCTVELNLEPPGSVLPDWHTTLNSLEKG